MAAIYGQNIEQPYINVMLHTSVLGELKDY